MLYRPIHKLVEIEKLETDFVAEVHLANGEVITYEGIPGSYLVRNADTGLVIDVIVGNLIDSHYVKVTEEEEEENQNYVSFGGIKLYDDFIVLPGDVTINGTLSILNVEPKSDVKPMSNLILDENKILLEGDVIINGTLIINSPGALKSISVTTVPVPEPDYSEFLEPEEMKSDLDYSEFLKIEPEKVPIIPHIPANPWPQAPFYPLPYYPPQWPPIKIDPYITLTTTTQSTQIYVGTPYQPNVTTSTRITPGILYRN